MVERKIKAGIDTTSSCSMEGKDSGGGGSGPRRNGARVKKKRASRHRAERGSTALCYFHEGSRWDSGQDTETRRHVPEGRVGH